jgi:predicted cobalt transporter CbtA
MRFGDLLRRGLAAGAAAGCLAALYIWLVVEPVLERALKVEDARTAAQNAEVIANGGHVHDEAAIVSRSEQVFGGALTVLVVGLLFGVVFAVVFAALRHRLPGVTDVARSLWLAVIGFGVFVVAPTITIPANPPAVGDPGSVTNRTGIWALSIALAGLLVLAGFVLSAQLRAKGLSDGARTAIVAAAAVVATGLAIWAVPASPDGIASDMGAQLVWDFRVVSIGMWALLFAALGVVFGLLVSRKAAVAEAREPVAA